MTFVVRPYRQGDLDAVYRICLETGDGGEDATHLHDDPDALGHLYVGPYVTLEPELAFVLEDGAGVCGYALGALDTPTFYRRTLREWLPPLQRRYPDPSGPDPSGADPSGDPDGWTPDQRLYHKLHHPREVFPAVLHPFPSHLHLDLLPRAQGRGHGTRMMHTLLDALRRRGSPGVHLGMHPDNHRALGFYRKLGFSELEDAGLPADTLYLGRAL